MQFLLREIAKKILGIFLLKKIKIFFFRQVFIKKKLLKNTYRIFIKKNSENFFQTSFYEKKQI